MGENSC